MLCLRPYRTSLGFPGQSRCAMKDTSKLEQSSDIVGSPPNFARLIDSKRKRIWHLAAERAACVIFLLILAAASASADKPTQYRGVLMRTAVITACKESPDAWNALITIPAERVLRITTAMPRTVAAAGSIQRMEPI